MAVLPMYLISSALYRCCWSLLHATMTKGGESPVRIEVYKYMLCVNQYSYKEILTLQQQQLGEKDSEIAATNTLKIITDDCNSYMLTCIFTLRTNISCWSDVETITKTKQQLKFEEMMYSSVVTLQSKTHTRN